MSMAGMRERGFYVFYAMVGERLAGRTCLILRFDVFWTK